MALGHEQKMLKAQLFAFTLAQCTFWCFAIVSHYTNLSSIPENHSYQVFETRENVNGVSLCAALAGQRRYNFFRFDDAVCQLGQVVLHGMDGLENMTNVYVAEETFALTTCEYYKNEHSAQPGLSGMELTFCRTLLKICNGTNC